MRLSEAIIKGSKGQKQYFGAFAKPKAEGNHAFCALGAAWRATRKYSQNALEHGDVDNVTAHFPFTKSNDDMSCPSCQLLVEVNVGDMVVHLNDDHEWGFKRIAAWVKKQEDRIEKEV